MYKITFAYSPPEDGSVDTIVNLHLNAKKAALFTKEELLSMDFEDMEIITNAGILPDDNAIWNNRDRRDDHAKHGVDYTDEQLDGMKIFYESRKLQQQELLKANKKYWDRFIEINLADKFEQSVWSQDVTDDDAKDLMYIVDPDPAVQKAYLDIDINYYKKLKITDDDQQLRVIKALDSIGEKHFFNNAGKKTSIYQNRQLISEELSAILKRVKQLIKFAWRNRLI